MIIHLILERNPELYLSDESPVDLDKVRALTILRSTLIALRLLQIIDETVVKYQEKRDIKTGLEGFYSECSGNTSSYLARTVLDTLLCHSSPDCKIS